MKLKNLFELLKGVQTVKSIMVLLGVNRQKAIYLIHRLRKAHYVKTKKNKFGERIYYISLENKLGGISYYDFINEVSPVKVRGPEYIVYGKTLSFEEALIFALKTKDLRVILASLASFKKITDWSFLYKLAKENDLVRQVGALYDLAKKYFMVRKMSERFRNNALPKKSDTYIYIIEGLKSKHFKEIEKKWKVHLPFNNQDLEDYK